MPILRDITLDLDPADVLRRPEGGRAENVNPTLQRLTGELYELVAEQGLIRPAVLYDFFPVTAVSENRVVLEEGAVLAGRMLAVQFASAEMVAGVLCTIGPGLGDLVSAFHAQDKALESLLLDGIGNAAMDALQVEACHRIRDRAADEGLQASGPLSPGLFGLPMENQSELHRLVRGERIGIALTAGLMMVPNKSISMIIGIGKEMPTWDKAQACSWCNLKKVCTYRVSAV